METSSEIWDVIIIGGGAAGLLAATRASQRNSKVLLLEKNKKIGVKILMSGGTRCNITHDCGIQGIIEAFGRNGKFLHSALAALPPADVVRLIELQGVATKIESTGKIFPVSDKAIDVRDALVRSAVQAGARILTQQPVERIQKTESGFAVATAQTEFLSRNLIITTGGKSYPGCGTTGDGYGWAIQMGHSIVDTFPALTPILSPCAWAHQLKGITIDTVDVRIDQSAAQPGSAKSRTLAHRDGSFLFTHWGFSGPAVLDVSREVARHPDRKSLELVCDFLPQQKPEALLADLNQRKASDGKQRVGNLLNDLFPKRLAEGFLTAAEVDVSIRNAELPKKTMNRIVQQLKSTRFSITGTLGFEKAEVTSGGVNLKEIDSKTMQSKLVKGLYFAGEVLDLDGYIGGFNFQSAFSTGWLAGQHV